MKKVFNLIILDESGSMESIKSATISGFNELIQSIRAEAAKISITNYISFGFDDASTVSALKSEIAYRRRFYNLKN